MLLFDFSFAGWGTAWRCWFDPLDLRLTAFLEADDDSLDRWSLI